MDLLRFLILLPIRLLRGLLHLLAYALRPLVGDIKWTAPAWPGVVRRNPRRSLSTVVGLLVLLALVWFGWYWYAHRPHPPHPERIHWTVQVPKPARYDHKKRIVTPLEIDFSASAAPIEKVDKQVAQGIHMNPATKGTWRWVNDRTLRFQPVGAWAVGQHYRVDFDVHNAFAPQVLMAADHLGFSTDAFTANVGPGVFHQDPEHVRNKTVIVPVTFNYPVDAASFERNVGLKLLGQGKTTARKLHFTVTYGPHKLHAYVHSRRLRLPRDPGSVEMTLDDGVHSALGGNGTEHASKTRVRVPGLYSLHVERVTPTLADNANHKPQQVLIAHFSGRITGGDLANHIRAWVLPRDRVQAKQQYNRLGDRAWMHRTRAKQQYDWSSSEVSNAVLQDSQRLPLKLSPTEHDHSALQSFKYHAKPGQEIYVRIDAGIKSFGGYVLGKPVTRVFTVPDYPKLLRFVGKGSLLSLSGSKRISIVSRNMGGMRLAIGRVLPDQLQHLASLNSGSYSHPRFNYGFSANQIVDRKVIERTFPESAPGKAHYAGVNLGPYLKGGGHGVFLLRLHGYNPASAQRRARQAAEQRALARQGMAPPPAGAQSVVKSSTHAVSGNGYEGPVLDSRLIVVTDLGLIVKRDLDGTQDVFVQSIHSGKPVAGARVAVIAVNGSTLYARTTGASGEVQFPSLKGLDDEKQPAMYRVTRGDDMSFLPIGASGRQLDYSRFDVGGAVNAVHRGKLSGYLFSDRGIYRPGSTFHIGIIVRAASWQRSVAGIPLIADIVDPRGVTVKQVPLRMDRSGFSTLSYAPPATAPTGTWTVNLRIVRGGRADTQIGSTTVQVKDFHPDQMKVDATLSSHVDQGWVKPDHLKGLVDAQNLFGTPAANRRVEASLSLRPAYPSFPRWKGYHFYDIRRAKRGYRQKLADGRTNTHGHAVFKLGLNKYANATYELYFLASVHAAGGGRSVAAAAQTLVSSDNWLIGYKCDDDLSYVSRDAVRKVHLTAINPHAKAIKVGGLKAQLVAKRYVSVLTKQDSGAYQYESRLKEVPLSEKPLTIPAKGLDYTLATDKPGNYELKILRASDNKEVNSVSYAVAGNANVSRSLQRNAELKLNLDKKHYKPGDTIDISIHAPYAGSGLITIERDKVYAHAWFRADTTSSVQHITIPGNFRGNGYVNVQFVRDPSSDDIFMSPLSYGVVPFSTTLKSRRNPLTLNTPKLVKPGQRLTFKLHAKHPTKAVVFAVDEGILQVARYKLGNPLNYFFRKKMLQVDTAQILDLILPEFKKILALRKAPGGGAEADIGRHLNPFKRKQKKPVAYWSGIVNVGSEKDLHYTVPDYFNGKLRVMAVAVSPERIGIAKANTTVRGDFVLSPNAPTTLAPGDVASVSVGVSNNLTHLGGKAVPVTVTLKAGPEVKVVGGDTKTLDLASMREGSVRFKIKATDTLGSSTLTFRAGYQGKSVHLGTSISVRPMSAYRTQVDVGQVDAGDSSTFTGVRSMFSAHASREAVMSSLPVVLAQGIAQYLTNYSHLCSEQLASAGMPPLVMQSWPDIPAFRKALHSTREKATHNANPKKTMARLIAMLQSRQNNAGGFGVWTATPDADPFVSDYVMNFLLEARARGVNVPQDMLDAGNTYLRHLAADNGMDSLAKLRQRAYAVYLLTREGNVTSNDLAAVQRRLRTAYPKIWKKDLAAAWLAASYKLLKQDDAANKLIAGPVSELERSTNHEPYAYGYYYDPLTRDSTVLYLLARDFPRRAKSLPPRVFENIARPLQQHRFNTLSAAMTILALDSYAKQNSAHLDKLHIQLVPAKGETHAIGKAEGGLLKAASWSGSVHKLRFVNDSSTRAWRVISQSGYGTNQPQKAIKQGLEVVQSFTDTHGKPLHHIVTGQEVDVHLKIRAIGSRGVGNVAIVDLLPGGFAPVIQPSAPLTDKQGSGDSDDQGDDSQMAASAWRSPIGLSSSSWHPEYADIRADRVVIYGRATPNVREFVYRIKATNAGTFQVPAVYAESMYNRRIQARSPAGKALTVDRPPDASGTSRQSAASAQSAKSAHTVKSGAQGAGPG